MGRNRPPNPELSTLALTTGSLLMLEVHASLEAYICKKLQDPATAHLRLVLRGRPSQQLHSRALHGPLQQSCLVLSPHAFSTHPPNRMPCLLPAPCLPSLFPFSFELSDSTVKGEGELKILSRLLHSNTGPRTTTSGRGSSSSGGEEGQHKQQQQGQQQGEETHLVLGSDSDLLLMALVAGKVRLLAGCRMPSQVSAIAGFCHRPDMAHGLRLKRLETGFLMLLQRGIYILGDEPSSTSHNRRRQRGSSTQHPPGASSRGAAAEGPALPLASVAASAASRRATSSSSSESSGSESDADDGSAELAAVLAAAETEDVSEEEDQAALIAFSRDAAEQLWREQHLVGEGASSSGSSRAEQEVTALALDLMLLATMCSGNDYLPAVQGMQLSNKHRPGLWDLFTAMRQEPQWRGQTLVLRSCECSALGASSSSSSGSSSGRPGGASRDCPTVSINAEMLGALLGEYYRQRVVHFEQPPGEGEGAAVGPGSSGGGSSSSVQGAVEGGALGSMDGGGSGASGSSSRGGDGLVWGEEGLAAAAAVAAASGSDDEGAEGAGRRGSNGGKKKGNITLRGMEAHPESYIQVGGWAVGL